jgi:O-antigen/teichoic acid export membrane protein
MSIYFFSVLVAYGRIKHITKVYVFNTLFGVVISFLLINYLNLLGAGIAFLLVNIMIAASLIVAASKFVAFKISKSITKPLVASALMAGMLLYLRPYAGTMQTALLLILGAAIFYFGMLYLIKGITKNDFRLLKYLRG